MLFFLSIKCSIILTPSTETELKNTKCNQSFDFQNYKCQLQSLSLPTSDLFWPGQGCDESVLSSWAGQGLSVYFKTLKKQFLLWHTCFWLLAKPSLSKVVAKQVRNDFLLCKIDIKYNMWVCVWVSAFVCGVKARWGFFCSAICLSTSCSKVTFRFSIVHIPYKAVASAWPRQPAYTASSVFLVLLCLHFCTSTGAFVCRAATYCDNAKRQIVTYLLT